jgi:hypothetical protein
LRRVPSPTPWASLRSRVSASPRGSAHRAGTNPGQIRDGRRFRGIRRPLDAAKRTRPALGPNGRLDRL